MNSSGVSCCRDNCRCPPLPDLVRTDIRFADLSQFTSRAAPGCPDAAIAFAFKISNSKVVSLHGLPSMGTVCIFSATLRVKPTRLTDPRGRPPGLPEALPKSALRRRRAPTLRRSSAILLFHCASLLLSRLAFRCAPDLNRTPP